MYFKETTMAEQGILKKHQSLNNVFLKKQQWMNNVFLKKQEWMNNVFWRKSNGWTMYFKETTMGELYI